MGEVKKFPDRREEANIKLDELASGILQTSFILIEKNKPTLLAGHRKVFPSVMPEGERIHSLKAALVNLIFVKFLATEAVLSASGGPLQEEKIDELLESINDRVITEAKDMSDKSKSRKET